MRYKNCPNKDMCWGYEENNCDSCVIGEKFTAQARKNMQNEKRACDKERVTLFELLEEIQRLKEWRFEHCKHRTGWCRDKHSCESCHFAKTKEIKNG